MTRFPRFGSLAVLVPALFALAASCSAKDAAEEPSTTDAGDAGGDAASLAIGQQAPWPTDDWTVVTPEEMGMDSALLDKARVYAMNADMKTESVVVVRGGAIVAEWYAGGYDKTSYAASWSMAKSFVSASLGIAISEGLVASVDDPLEKYYPEWAGQPRGQIPLRALLQMQSGLDFIEDYVDFANSDVIKIGATADVLNYMLTNVDVAQAPDSRWYYSSGDTQLLSGAVARVSGKTNEAYVREKIFDPIGMHAADWWSDGADHTIAFCCLDAPTREFAKFGLLFLRGGQWDGKQIVPESWVKESTQTAASHYDGYAYQWWKAQGDSLLPHDLYWADGKDDQKIYVIPSLDLVVAKNSIYRKPPGDAVAPTGYVQKFTPGGLTPYGTLAAQLWEDGPFLSAIIRSITGATQVEIPATPPPGSSPNDPVACREAAHDGFGTYCEEMHGCVCDHCAVQFLDCAGVAACKAIMQCGLDKGCRGIACAGPCQGVIEQNGGIQGAGVTYALALSDCALSCPVSCP